MQALVLQIAHRTDIERWSPAVALDLSTIIQDGVQRAATTR